MASYLSSSSESVNSDKSSASSSSSSGAGARRTRRRNRSAMMIVTYRDTDIDMKKSIHPAMKRLGASEIVIRQEVSKRETRFELAFSHDLYPAEFESVDSKYKVAPAIEDKISCISNRRSLFYTRVTKDMPCARHIMEANLPNLIVFFECEYLYDFLYDLSNAVVLPLMDEYESSQLLHRMDIAARGGAAVCSTLSNSLAELRSPDVAR